MWYLIDVWHTVYLYSVLPEKHVIIDLCKQLTHFHTIHYARVIRQQRLLHPSRLQYQKNSIKLKIGEESQPCIYHLYQQHFSNPV